MEQRSKTFITGERVPWSGIYAIEHAAHRLDHHVAMFQGEVFPRCGRCSGTVMFRLLREFPGLDVGGVPTLRVPLTELPELDQDPPSLATA